MVEGARLEIVWAEMSRRFESSRFRQNVCIDSLVVECRFGRFLFETKVNLSLLMVAERYPTGRVIRKKVGYVAKTTDFNWLNRPDVKKAFEENGAQIISLLDE